MHVLELKKEKIINFINENETVIICYYEKNSIISDLMIGTMNVLKRKLHDNVVVILSNKTNDTSIVDFDYPKVEIFKNKKLIFSHNGFYSYKKIIKYLI